jgi:hypothetical protein
MNDTIFGRKKNKQPLQHYYFVNTNSFFLHTIINTMPIGRSIHINNIYIESIQRRIYHYDKKIKIYIYIYIYIKIGPSLIIDYT